MSTPDNYFVVKNGFESLGPILSSGVNIGDLLNQLDVAVSNVAASSGDWDDTYTTVQQNSAAWSSEFQELVFDDITGELTIFPGNTVSLSALSAGYSEAGAVFTTNSARYESSYTTLTANSSFWDETYTSYSSNSGTFAVGNISDYLPLSGGDLTGSITVTGGVSATNTIYSSALRVGHYDSEEFDNVPSAIASFHSNTDSIGVVDIHNESDSAFASADLFLIPDNGSESAHYLDIGITSSNYNNPDISILEPNTGYLYVQDGDLLIGVSQPQYKVRFFAGGVTNSNEVLYFTPTDITINRPLSTNSLIKTVDSDSDKWASGYEGYVYISSVSGNWTIAESVLASNSSNWDQSYSYINSSSAFIADNFTILAANSAAWTAAYTFVAANSSAIQSLESTIIANSGNWDETYTSYAANSGTFTTFTYISNNYLPLSGGTLTGNLSTNDIIYAKNGDSDQWNESYSYTNSSSSFIDDVYTVTSLNSGNWDEAYTYSNTTSTFVFDGYTVVANNSGKWDDTYTTVNANSASWGEGGALPTDVTANSANWNEAYSYSNTTSSILFDGYTVVADNSGKWDDTYTTVNTNSASWGEGGALPTDVTSNSANWNEAYSYANTTSAAIASGLTDVAVTSAFWNESYSYTNSTSSAIDETITSVTVNSGVWDEAYSYANTTSGTIANSLTDIAVTSAFWNDTYTVVSINSADWFNEALPTDITSNSANWESTYSTVGSNSGSWSNVFTTVYDTSANWDLAYNRSTVYATNSASYATTSYVENNFLSLSGGTIIGDMSLSGNVTIFGTISALSGITIIGDTLFTTTSSLSIVNVGPGPALYVKQAGFVGEIATFEDTFGTVLYIGNRVDLGTGGEIGINTTTPNKVLTVVGDISATAVISSSAIDIGLYGTGAVLPDVIAQFTADVDNYSQINTQNLNAGNFASADYVATADNGSDTSNYIDLGINNSNFSDPNYSALGTNDGYLYINGGNLLFGTDTGHNLIFTTNGLLSTDVRMVILSTGNIGIGTSNPGAPLTVVGVISSNNTIIAANGNSELWNSVYTNVQSNSAAWFNEALPTDITANSANWSEAYSFVNTNSAFIFNAITDVSASSANWDESYSYSNSTSALISSAISDVIATSANWNESYSYSNSTSAFIFNVIADVSNLSGSWNEAYTYANTVSASTQSVNTAVIGNSANWDESYSYSNSTSAFIFNVIADVAAASGSWDDTYTTVNTNSASWGGGALPTDITANSANWQSTYETVSSLSGDWGLISTATYNRWDFLGNPPTVVFSISGAESINPIAYLVTIDAVVQDTLTYTINTGTGTITFQTAPLSGSVIVVIETSLGTVSPFYIQSTYTTVNANSATWGSGGGGAPGQAAGLSTQVQINSGGYLSGAPGFVFVDGKVGIGTVSPTYTLEVSGNFAATTKSFIIDHPTIPGKKLQYGVLEGPSHDVFIRGRATSDTILLPDYWVNLVHDDSITVQLTPIGIQQSLVVVETNSNRVLIRNEQGSCIDCYYFIQGERKDVSKLINEL